MLFPDKPSFFESRQVGERVLAGEHLAATRANDLILYDRGYPAFWLFAVHHQIEVLATSLLDEQTYCAGAWK